MAGLPTIKILQNLLRCSLPPQLTKIDNYKERSILNFFETKNIYTYDVAAKRIYIVLLMLPWRVILYFIHLELNFDANCIELNSNLITNKSSC